MLIIASLTELLYIVRKCYRFYCCTVYTYRDLQQVHVHHAPVLHSRWLQTMKLSTIIKCEFLT